ncbi:MAG TPA: hypothetical protein VFM72_06915, partial [Aequorivita sp.]|nr:hypothetical protein [Aequorivita sp.]
MNKILLFFLLTSGIASAQIVNIPDANFKSELIANGVDTNTDGEIQVSEALATIAMDLDNPNITDLTGIEAFVNLETFQCISLSVISLDFTSNINLIDISVLNTFPNQPTSIDVSSCIALESLTIIESFITTLDLSANVNLTALYIANNPLLETVFIKNGSDESSNMGSGSWMENWAFGNNPSLQYVCADDFQATEIQQFAGTNYPVNSYCTFPPGGEVNTITGVSQFDNDGNGCNPGDSPIPYTSFNIEFNGDPTNGMAYGNSEGIYNVFVAEVGTYTLIPNLENPTYFSVSPASADVLIPIIDESTVVQDFCVEANGVHPDLEVIIAPV